MFAGVVVFLEKRNTETACRKESDTNVTKENSLTKDPRFWFYFYLNLGALVLYVFCSFLPIISRIGYYLTVSHILFLPMLLERIADKRWRKVFRLGVILAAVLYFVMYMSRASDDGVLILPYRSFFFHDMVNILSDMN